MGATANPSGSSNTADRLTRCRASVSVVGPIWRGSSNGLFGSWMFAVFNWSTPVPMLLFALARVYDAEKSTPFDRRRRMLVMSALYSLRPRLTAGRLLFELGLSGVGRSAEMRRIVVPAI